MDPFFSRVDYNFPAIPLFPMSSTPLLTRFYPSSSSQRAVPLSPEVEYVEAVEMLLNYNFRDKTLLKEALTLSSPSYERFEFLGDSAIGLALSNHFYITYPKLEPHELSQLRATNVSTEKLARLALIHGLYPFLLHNCPTLNAKVKEFAEAVSKEDDGSAVYGGLVKAPKVLADLFESVAGAIYVDVNFDLKRFWVIFRALLEPMFTLDDMQQQPQPVSMLFRMCQKHGKRVDIRNTNDGNSCIASVYLDDEVFCYASAESRNTARLIASKEALEKLFQIFPMNIDEDFEDVQLEDAKRMLYIICSKKKWPNPIFSVEELHSVNGKQFVCAAKIPTEEGTLYMKGDEMPRKREAENSSAFHMIRALRHSDHLLWVQ